MIMAKLRDINRRVRLGGKVRYPSEVGYPRDFHSPTALQTLIKGLLYFSDLCFYKLIKLANMKLWIG